jgi:hypothetical protein
MIDTKRIKKGDRYLFIPNGLSDVKKEVTILSEPEYNGVCGEDVVKVAELFGLTPVSLLHDITD